MTLQNERRGRERNYDSPWGRRGERAKRHVKLEFVRTIFTEPGEGGGRASRRDVYARCLLPHGHGPWTLHLFPELAVVHARSPREQPRRDAQRDFADLPLPQRALQQKPPRHQLWREAGRSVAAHAGFAARGEQLHPPASENDRAGTQPCQRNAVWRGSGGSGANAAAFASPSAALLTPSAEQDCACDLGERSQRLPGWERQQQVEDTLLALATVDP